MSVPAINPITSILAFPKGQLMPAYWPSATGSPTSWACYPVPAGLSFNTTSGKLTGTPTEAGVYELQITATNGTGTSAPLLVALGIFEGAGLTGAYVPLNWELGSNKITRPGAASGEPVIVGVVGSTLLYALAITQGGVPQDLGALTGLRLVFKATDEDSLIYASTGNSVQMGIGSSARYLFACPLVAETFEPFVFDMNAAPATDPAYWDALAQLSIGFPTRLPGATEITITDVSARLPFGDARIYAAETSPIS